MSAIVVEGIVRRFAGQEALRGLSFAVEPGQLYGLIGPDGAGKTTAISCIAGLMDVHAGEVSVLGSSPFDSAIREQLGLMPQEYSLYGDLTVYENLRFFGRLFGLDRSVFRERVERLLDITRLKPFTKRRASALSGGMYKKLALSCALLHEPRVLLLDEPTNGVDPVSRRELWELVHEFAAEGMAVLLSTPTMEEAARCHRVGLVHHGAMIAEGAPRELIASLKHEVYEVRGGERAQLHEVFDAADEVVAASPAGERLRVIVNEGMASRLEKKLGGASLVKVRPSFEDVFLTRVEEAEAKEHSEAA